MPVDLVDAVLVEIGRHAGVVAGSVGGLLGAGDHLHMSGPVGQALGLDHAVGHVHAEPVHSAVQPEAQDVIELAVDLRVLPVQIRLGGVEEVQVPLAVLGPGGAGGVLALADPGPGRAAEEGLPVVGRLCAVGPCSLTEHVALALRASRPGGQGGTEPGVLIRGVVGHQVHHHADAQAVRRVDQLIGILQRAEERIDVPIVGHVISRVVLRGAVERGEPDRVHAQLRQVVQAGGDAGQVAHAVAVAVGEGARIDLVDHRMTPPFGLLGRLDVQRGGCALRGRGGHIAPGVRGRISRSGSRSASGPALRSSGRITTPVRPVPQVRRLWSRAPPVPARTAAQRSRAAQLTGSGSAAAEWPWRSGTAHPPVGAAWSAEDR